MNKAELAFDSQLYLDREQKLSSRALENDLVSYLGEYFWEIPVFNYQYIEKKSDGRTILTAPGLEEEGDVEKIFLNAISQKEKAGKDSSRERSELTGFRRLKQELGTSPTGSTFAWFSPPGEGEGFGNYSFVFLGQIKPGERLDERLVDVSAARINLSLDQHVKILNGLSATYQLPPEATVNEILRSPAVLTPDKGYTDRSQILSVMKKRLDDDQISQKYLDRFFDQNNSYLRQQLALLQPLIDRYIQLASSQGTKEELERLRARIETEAIYARYSGRPTVDEIEILTYESYDPIPQTVVIRGSCGATEITLDGFAMPTFGRVEFTILQGFKKEKWEYHKGDCLDCSAKNTDVGPCSICKSCEAKYDRLEFWRQMLKLR